MFVHWPISPGALRPLIPAELELDLFDGTAYVGLVPFTMKGVRPVGLPAVAGLSSFHETNVRTYVRLADRDPGVWFFNLEAANAIAVPPGSIAVPPSLPLRANVPGARARRRGRRVRGDPLRRHALSGLDLYRPRMPCERRP